MWIVNSPLFIEGIFCSESVIGSELVKRMNYLENSMIIKENSKIFSGN
jgi:hypothetical protein